MRVNKLKYILPLTGLILSAGFPLTKGEKQESKAVELSGQGEAGVIQDGSLFQRRWNCVSETSAVIYWQLNDSSKSTTGYVEYGTAESLGQKTEETKKPRWAHFHRLSGLVAGTTFYYRMVMIDPTDGTRIESEILQLTPQKKEGTVYIPHDTPGNPPYTLTREKAHYVLTEDIIASGTAIIVEGNRCTLDLDGHTITFGNNTSSQVFGVQVNTLDSCRIVNGKIVQGVRSGEYCNAVRSFKSSGKGVEVCGISTDVHLRNAQPMNFRHAQVEVHHNDIYSRVTELESRHYPGNSLIRFETSGKNIHIHDNLLTEGCHRGIWISTSGTLTNVEINHNDIQHHQQYVNGYAIAPGTGAMVHHNRITSTGRGVHLTGEGTLFYNNYLDIRGHQDLDDIPSGTRPFEHQLVELHGIKLEGSNTKNCRIFDNFVKIIQTQPVDSDGKGDPADKADNGVYFRSMATSIENGKLTDTQQKWEKDRWRYYYVKYDSGKPPVKLTGNDSTTLFGNFEVKDPSEYTVYMKWNYVPPTPLNIACYDPSAMNEIYGNTFIGITTYQNPRHGPYGDTGEWGTALMFVGMVNGAAGSGKYSAWIHDNLFFSNDLFINNSNGIINMDIRVENNTFNLLDEPFTTERSNRILNVGTWFETQVRNSSNVFNETPVNVVSIANQGIMIYPNPAKTTLTITGKSGQENLTSVTVYSSEGSKIHEDHKVTFPYRIDISTFPPGLYIVRIQTDNGYFTEKVIIE